MKKKCCQKSLFREGARFCVECGRKLQRSRAEKESLFFAVSHMFDSPDEACDFVEDYDRYGDACVGWHGLVSGGAQ